MPEVDAEVRLHEKPRSIHQMFRETRQSVDFLPIVKTAADVGWFTNGKLLTKLTEEEDAWFKKIAAKHDLFYTDKIDVMRELRGRTMGSKLYIQDCYPQGTDFPYRPSLVKLASAFNEIVYVPTWIYATMRKRHPCTTIHLTSWDGGRELPIIFCEGKWIQAMVMPVNIMG